jgi:hypothetical protein
MEAMENGSKIQKNSFPLSNEHSEWYGKKSGRHC